MGTFARGICKYWSSNVGIFYYSKYSVLSIMYFAKSRSDDSNSLDIDLDRKRKRT